jgi:hypothetical protein
MLLPSIYADVQKITCCRKFIIINRIPYSTVGSTQFSSYIPFYYIYYSISLPTPFLPRFCKLYSVRSTSTYLLEYRCTNQRNHRVSTWFSGRSAIYICRWLMRMEKSTFGQPTITPRFFLPGTPAKKRTIPHSTFPPSYLRGFLQLGKWGHFDSRQEGILLFKKLWTLSHCGLVHKSPQSPQIPNSRFSPVN